MHGLPRSRGQGSARCFPCDLHLQCAPGGLADVVVPVAFAIKGGPHARRLWQYKSPRLTAAAAAGPATLLRALLLVFLRDHDQCLWRAAGMSGPTHVAVVPIARARPGPHPLRTLVQLPGHARAGPGGQARRRTSQGPGSGAVQGAAAAGSKGPAARRHLGHRVERASAAMALRLAGARSVVTVVLGRHVNNAAGCLASVRPGMPLRPGSCAVHEARAVGSRP